MLIFKFEIKQTNYTTSNKSLNDSIYSVSIENREKCLYTHGEIAT